MEITENQKEQQAGVPLEGTRKGGGRGDLEPMAFNADRMRRRRHVAVRGALCVLLGGVGGAGAHNKKEVEETRRVGA